MRCFHQAFLFSLIIICTERNLLDLFREYIVSYSWIFVGISILFYCSSGTPCSLWILFPVWSHSFLCPSLPCQHIRHPCCLLLHTCVRADAFHPWCLLLLVAYRQQSAILILLLSFLGMSVMLIMMPTKSIQDQIRISLCTCYGSLWMCLSTAVCHFVSMKYSQTLLHVCSYHLYCFPLSDCCKIFPFR